MRVGSLCAGYGGLDMAVHEVLGGELAWVADNDPGAAAILAHRFPSVPNFGDITAIDWSAVERVDVLTAGFPCQDISCAGRRAGLREGNRSGLWFHVARAIKALRPPLVVIENVKELLSERADSDVEPCPWCLGDTGPESAMRALGAVLADLAEIGFDAEWVSVPAASAGACHLRWRVFILAWPAADTGSSRRREVPRGAPGDEGALARRTAALDHEPRGARADASADTEGIGTREPADEADTITGGRGARALPGSGGTGAIAAAECPGRQGREPAASGGGWRSSGGSGQLPAHPQGDGRDEGGAESARLVRRLDAPLGSRDAPADPAGIGRVGHHEPPPVDSDRQSRSGSRPGDRLAPADAERGGRGGRPPEPQREPEWGDAATWHRPGAFGRYEAAVRQHERAFGRLVPAPVAPGRNGDPRLSPVFTEWMMGLPEGWVTDVPGLSRNAQLKALGNGVVPAAAALALALLLERAGFAEAGEAA